jgi:hypothetical protein
MPYDGKAFARLPGCASIVISGGPDHPDQVPSVSIAAPCLARQLVDARLYDAERPALRATAALYRGCGHTWGAPSLGVLYDGINDNLFHGGTL